MQNAVAANIRGLLAIRGTTRLDLAGALGWSESYLYRRLTGRAELTLDEFDLLCRTLQVTPSALLTPSAFTPGASR